MKTSTGNSCITSATQRGLLPVAMMICLSTTILAQPNPNGKDRSDDNVPRAAIAIPVSFPIDSAGEGRLIRQLESVLNQSSGMERPLVILEFVENPAVPKKDDHAVGRGTSFERALSIARWISGAKGSRIRTVAYLKESVVGHAVLIALACEEIGMAADAEFGLATIDEPAADDTIKQAYVDIAKRRGGFPAAAVLSMLDPTETLFKLELEDRRVEYCTASELKTKGRPEGAWNEEQLVPNNQLFQCDGHTLRRWQWIAHTAIDREQLGQALKLTRPIVEKPQFSGPRVAIRTHVRGLITRRLIDRTIRAIEESLSKPETNLVVIEIDSPGGNLDESIRMAQFLADIDASKAEVVCFLPARVLGDASLIALACDSIYMHPDAKIGGPGEASISEATCREKKFAFDGLATLTGRPIGQLLGCVSPDVPVFEYSAFDGRVILSSPEWLQDNPVAPQWTKGESISFEEGLDYENASKMNIATDSIVSIDEIAGKFGLESLPKERETNTAEQIVDWLTGHSGVLSFFLISIGIVALGAELSSPGVGVPGAIAALCFGAFFWLNFLNGTVEWLEVLLILGGIIFVAIELFLLPGFGVFGFTGIAMVGIGLVLAGQTFVLPTNDYQKQRFVEGAGQLGLVALTIIGLSIVFRKQIANSPMVKWLTLTPQAVDRDKEEKESIEEELQTFIGWYGSVITRCNPAGRALIGERVMNVTADEGWIDEGSEIVVLGKQGTTLVVTKKPVT